MSEDDARWLAEFIKDHDKRFEAKAKTDGPDAVVLLTQADDGTELEPLADITQYQATHIDGEDDPGPTVRAAWERWQNPVGPGR